MGNAPAGGKGRLTNKGYVVPTRAKATIGSAEQVNAANNELVNENNQLREDNERLIDEVNKLTAELASVNQAGADKQRLGNIATALELLDHAKDESWTDEGKPRVEVICALMEDDTITRAEIEAALPDFVRVKPSKE